MLQTFCHILIKRYQINLLIEDFCPDDDESMNDNLYG
jgi:hypothetical protein